MDTSRSAVENDGRNLVFGKFYGRQLLNIKHAYFDYKKAEGEKANYKSFMRMIFNSMRIERRRRFDCSFYTFLGDLAKARSLMRKSIEIEMTKREIEEEKRAIAAFALSKKFKEAA